MMAATNTETHLDLSSIPMCPVAVDHPFDPYIRQDWVKLANDEEELALILCTHDDQQWVAWIPSQGEAIVHRDELCRLPC
jgi:hypothetical protein